MSNQQMLSGMEIRTLAERIVKQHQESNIDLRLAIETILRDYILIPKHVIVNAEGPVTMTFGPTPIKED